jgi:hypothetical protein
MYEFEFGKQLPVKHITQILTKKPQETDSVVMNQK